MSLTKPMLGLAVGGVLGLMDGLSGFFEPSLAPVMGSVITFSLLKGLVAGITTGYVSRRVHSMLLGILAGIGIAAVLSLLVILHGGWLCSGTLWFRACCLEELWDSRRSASGGKANRPRPGAEHWLSSGLFFASWKDS